MARNKYSMQKLVQNDLQQCINSFERMKRGGIGIADECVEDTCKRALKYIDALEAKLAESEPVRHGHWYNRGGRFRCSVCDDKALLKDIGGTGGRSHEYEQQKSPYCPNCGAKMDGDNNLDINCCEYCRVNDDFKCSVIHFDGGDNGTVDVQMPFDEMEIIYRKDEKTVFHLDFEINYCPMCGRKLKTDGKENDNDQR